MQMCPTIGKGNENSLQVPGLLPMVFDRPIREYTQSIIERLGCLLPWSPLHKLRRLFG